MSIQYSGNAQSSTFTPTTKQTLINSVGAALLAAGWTTISGGSGTTNWMLQSATTPQGYAINIRMKDNAGTCVTFSLESTDGVLVGGNSTTVGGGYLNPAAGATWRITCSKYQAFIGITPNVAVSRSFCAFGVPYVPSWMTGSTSRIGWMMGNALNDTDTTVRESFRTQIINGSNMGQQQSMYNSVIWSTSGGGNNGALSLASFVCPANNTTTAGYRWENNAALVLDPLISWGTTAANVDGRFKGLLWDAVLSTDAYTADLTTTFDSHNWIVVTDNNTGFFGGSWSLRGTLVVATS